VLGHYNNNNNNNNSSNNNNNNKVVIVVVVLAAGVIVEASSVCRRPWPVISRPAYCIPQTTGFSDFRLARAKGRLASTQRSGVSDQGSNGGCCRVFVAGPRIWGMQLLGMRVGGEGWDGVKSPRVCWAGDRKTGQVRVGWCMV
jgi:hypothetical protein